MLTYSHDDIIATFRSAKNLNAAIKSFLKGEVTKGHPAERFAKSFRSAYDAQDEARLTNFIEKNLPQFEKELLLIANYAHADVIGRASDRIISTHAESFNETYARSDGEITVTDPSSFKKIINNAFTIIEEELGQTDVPDTPFLRNVFILTIFDEDLVDKVSDVVA